MPDAHYHHSCLRTFEKERSRAEFSEARLKGLEGAIRELGQKMDGINGHEVHERLGRKTLGGAVRALIIKD